MVVVVNNPINIFWSTQTLFFIIFNNCLFFTELCSTEKSKYHLIKFQCVPFFSKSFDTPLKQKLYQHMLSFALDL